MDILDRGGANDDEITYPALVEALAESRVHLIDVREQNEWDAGHVEGATLHPLSVFQPEILPRDKPIVFICRSGNRSMTTLKAARAVGLKDVWHYKGGAIGWAAEGGKLV